MSEADSVKKYVAELIGTFVLVFIGCGTAVMSLGYVGSYGVAFAFGLSLLALIYTIGSISGCHVNPAVSISMFAAGKMKAKDTVLYILFQCIGATLGAAVLYLVAAGNPSYSIVTRWLGQNGYENASPGGYSMMSALVAEIVLTFIFVLVIHGSTSEKAPQGFAGVSIGLALAFIHLVGIPITGTSVNPARSLGPALIAGGTALNQLWLFWVAPIIGGLLAAAVWRLFK
jgi:aquaporin Z